MPTTEVIEILLSRNEHLLLIDHRKEKIILNGTKSASRYLIHTFSESPLSSELNVIRYLQKYSRLRCLLLVKGLVICFHLGLSGSTLQIRTNIRAVVRGGQFLTDQLTLSQPGGQIIPTTVLRAPPPDFQTLRPLVITFI